MTVRQKYYGASCSGRGGEHRPQRFRSRLLLASLLSAALSAAGFATGAPQAGTGQAGAAAPEPSAAPADLAQWASRSGCVLRPGTGNADYRQGSCDTAAGRIVLLTFTSTRGRQQWKTEAESYGEYLLGPRWAIGGDPAVLEGLRDRLGGTLEGSRQHQHPA